MRIDDLLAGVDILDLRHVDADAEVNAITADSREVARGSVFVAIPGTKQDGHAFIPQALAAGATLVIQSAPLPQDAVGGFVRVADPRRVYGELCAGIAGEPSTRISVIGVTGTNGKTSTTLLVAHLLNAIGKKCAVLGTLGLRRGGEASFEMTGLTTPDAGVLQRTLAELADSGHTHLAMEVSSHALAQERVAGTQFAGGVFTNLTQDHFDYHATMEEYFDAKALLFSRYLTDSSGYSVLNLDDAHGARLLGIATGTVVTYGQSEGANLFMREVATRASGTDWELLLKNGHWPDTLREGVNWAQLHTPLAGRYNAYNCTAAAAVALLEGATLAEVAGALASFPGVPGRLERVENARGINVYVDYAHTPDALLNVLAALRELRTDGARIITVFGCGGDRDPDKRPKMGAAAQIGSDVCVVTSDNPRSEDPAAIIAQIVSGMDVGETVAVEPDRRAAIRLALGMSRPDDIVLIAGKGHEDYQILADRTIHFSDVEEVEAWFTAPARTPPR